MSDEIDVGGVVATVRLDSGKADEALNNVIRTINRFGSALDYVITIIDKLQEKSDNMSPAMNTAGAAVQAAETKFTSAADAAERYADELANAEKSSAALTDSTKSSGVAIDKTASTANKLGATSGDIAKTASALSAVETSAASAAQSVNQTHTAMKSSSVEKYDAKLAQLNSDYQKQVEIVNRLGAELDALIEDFYKLSAASGDADSFDPAKIFPTESTALDNEFDKLEEIKAKIKEVTEAREKAASAAASAANKQTAAADNVAAAAKKEAAASNAANMALDTGATALRAVTSAAGGTVSKLGYLGTELVYLKRNIQAASTAATKMTVIFSFGVMAAVTLVSAGISRLQEIEEERQETFENGVKNLQEYSDQLNILKQNIEILNDSTSTTEQLTQARNKLTSTFDDLIVGYTKEGEAILANNEALEKEIELLKRKANYERKKVLANSNEISLEDYRLDYLYLEAVYSGYDDLKAKYENNWVNKIQEVFGHDELDPDNVIENYESRMNDFEKRANAYLELNFEMRDSNGKLIKTWDDLSASEQATANSLKLDIFEKFKDGTFTTMEEAQKYLNEMMSDKEFVNQYYRDLESQTQKQAETVKALKKAYDDLNTTISSSITEMSSFQSKMASAYAELTENGKLSQSTINSLISAYPQLIDYLDIETGQLNLTEDTMRELYEIQKQLHIAELEESKTKLRQNEEKIKSNCELAESELKVAEAMLMTIGYDAAYKAREYNYEEKQRAFKDAKKELEELQASCSRIDTLIENINNTKLDLTAESGGIKKTAKTVSEYSQALEKLNHQKRMGQLGIKEEIAALEELGRKYVLSADERIDLEYRIYSAKKQYEEEIERARAKALQDQYTQMENLKSLGKLNAEQELEWLEKIRKTYKMNAEERIALEIKIYNLKEELRQNEVSALDDLGAAITEALKNQYEEQRKAERDRINESIEAWEQWEKSTVEAIQAEIDALDALEKEQESQSAAAEFYRKSQELKLQIAYEKDDYQRKQLEKELNRLTEEEEERLRKEQLEKQREELQNQIDEARNTAEERKKALEEELKVIDENYDKLTSALSLRAQAEQIIMQQSQEQIITLIKSYAPEYDLAGQSIGESLYEAFKSKVDNIYTYIEEVMASIRQYQENAKAAAVKAANDFEQSYRIGAQSSQPPNSVSVYYTSNFNTPVQSPVQTKRAIESTASNIAAMIR